jgi:hypothetical protein
MGANDATQSRKFAVFCVKQCSIMRCMGADAGGCFYT